MNSLDPYRHGIKQEIGAPKRGPEGRPESEIVRWRTGIYACFVEVVRNTHGCEVIPPGLLMGKLRDGSSVVHYGWNVVGGYLVVVTSNFFDDVVGVETCFKHAGDIEGVVIRTSGVVGYIASEEDLGIWQVDCIGDNSSVLLESVCVPACQLGLYAT